MTQPIQLLSTTPSKEIAEKIATLILDKRLAACVQISGPITSLYHWKNKLTKDQEWELKIKTLDSLVTPLEKLITQNHPYDIPEIIGTELTFINKSYLEWLKKSVTSQPLD